MDICVDVRWQLIPAEAEEVSVVNISTERHDGTPIQQQIDGCLWVLKAIILCRDPRGSAVGDPAHALHQTQPEHAQKPHQVSKGREGSMTWLARTIFDTLPLAGCFSCVVDSGKTFIHIPIYGRTNYGLVTARLSAFLTFTDLLLYVHSTRWCCKNVQELVQHSSISCNILIH